MSLTAVTPPRWTGHNHPLHHCNPECGPGSTLRPNRNGNSQSQFQAETNPNSGVGRGGSPHSHGLFLLDVLLMAAPHCIILLLILVSAHSDSSSLTH